MTVLALIAAAVMANAQMSKSKLEGGDPESLITRGPEYHGGVEALANYFEENYVYPEKALRMGVEGIVTLEFYIDKDGTVAGDIQVIRSVGEELDQEAVRLAKNMPTWKPALQNGKSVKVKYQLPIHFVLP